ncbi:uracil-DNA glycosylase, mitochondrial isoform X2 [Musa acuminata AAA Group]|uniref:uracil-DNA glycosylase, mitochondrial isoform X2 n=1 Tax=Musa acuminata AAA Group TaxID=214697 RepID=UPI0031D6A0A1
MSGWVGVPSPHSRSFLRGCHAKGAAVAIAGWTVDAPNLFVIMSGLSVCRPNRGNVVARTLQQNRATHDDGDRQNTASWFENYIISKTINGARTLPVPPKDTTRVATVRGHSRGEEMAASAKTLAELLRPLSPSTKIQISKSSFSARTPEQKKTTETNKAQARSKRDLRICTDIIEKSRAEKMEYAKLEELLVEETWLEALEGELQKPYAKNLCRFVEREMRGSVPIYPPPHLIFDALHRTPFHQVKAVIIGQDPYHGPGQAMGLAFSVPEGIKVPSSLVNIFKELRQDVGCSLPSHGNLERWAVQGVLLLNAVLTVRKHQANSHAKKGWEPFTDAIIQIISQKKTGVVFLLWGNSAQAKSRLIDESKHHILRAAHPSGLSANRGFFGCRHFSQTNQILEKLNLSPIDWQL